MPPFKIVLTQHIWAITVIALCFTPWEETFKVMSEEKEDWNDLDGWVEE